MASPRTRKVLSDLLHNKARSAMVILSIATGVFAVGAVAGSRESLTENLNKTYQRSVAPHATLYFRDPIPTDLHETVRNFRGIAEAQSRRSYDVRVQRGDDDWRPLNLTALLDFKDIRIAKLRHLTGPYPPRQDEVLMERSSMELLGVKEGDKVLVETPTRKKRILKIAGTVHDPTQPPTFFTGRAAGFVHMDTLEALGEEPRPDAMVLRVDGNPTRAEVNKIIKTVRNRLDASGYFVVWAWVPPPGQHPVSDAIDTLVLIMSALGILVLLLSGFLLVNTISAILTQQTRQIGVMKAVGATTPQIAWLYICVVLLFCTMSVIIAVPLGAVTSRAAVGYLAGLLNFDVEDFEIPRNVLLGELALGYLIPLVASFPPIFRAARITVREAVGFTGLSGGAFGGSLVDKIVSWVRFLSRPALLSLRNTFRRKGRLALTLATLTTGGSIFMAVFSVRASMEHTIDEALAYFNYDVELYFQRPYRADQILQYALGTPGVEAAETWGFHAAQIVKDWKGTGENRVLMLAPPAETRMLNPTMVAGRWLLKDDENAVVLNTDALKNNPDVKVGDRIKMRVGLYKTEWTVVGIVRGVMSGPFAYVNRPYYALVSREGGSASSLQVFTTQHTPEFQQQVGELLEKRLKDAGIKVSDVSTTSEWKSRMVRQFSVIMSFLLIMAALMAFVGGLALMGTMGINVIERTREIGVIRAVGATTSSVLGIFMLEGMAIGMLSWLLSTLMAIPVGKVLSDQVGMMFSRAPLHFTISSTGIAFWFVFMLILSAMASILPAFGAARVRVREVLAAE